MTRTDEAGILEPVERAMQRVLSDIDATTPYRPTMRFEDGDDWPRTVVCWGFIDALTGTAISYTQPTARSGQRSLLQTI